MKIKINGKIKEFEVGNFKIESDDFNICLNSDGSIFIKKIIFNSAINIMPKSANEITVS